MERGGKERASLQEAMRPWRCQEGSDTMNMKITMLGIVILLFLGLVGCVGYVGYADYDSPYGHGYYYDGPYYHSYGGYGYSHHYGHHDRDFDRDDR